MSTTPVDPIFEMKIDGVWTDITEDVRLNSADSGGGINIVRGIPNEGNRAEPTQLDFVLNNRHGDYSPKNPYSVNYGKLGRNQPVRVGLSRRRDTFQRTETDSWGRLPSRVTPENVTVLGERWNLTGTATAFDVTTGAATIQAASGYRMATFGTYGDVEVLTKVKVSNLTSEFGIVMRLKSTIESVDPGDFEHGLGSWVPTGGTSTLAISTAQFHSGTSSALLTVAGSPASVTARTTQIPVVPGRSYRLRMWVRCSATRNIIASLDWIDSALAPVSSSTSTTAVTANTWTVIELTATAPDAAAFLKYGPTMDTSPANGTLLFLDDIEVLDLSDIELYSAYITPGTPDLLRLGKVVDTFAEAISQSRPVNVVANDFWWFKAQMSGIRRRVKFWKDGDAEPLAWNWRTYATANATNDHIVPEYGEVGVFCKDGTALVTFAEVEINQWRAHAEIAKLPQRWDLSRQDRWVPVAARGILQRLGQGRKSLDSAVTLHLQEYTTSRLWIPLETVDPGSNLAGNRIDGGADAYVGGLSQGTPDQTGTFALPGVSGYAILENDNSFLIARTKPGAAAGTYSNLVFWRIPAAPSADILLWSVETSGTVRRFLIYLQTDLSFRVELRSDVNALIASGFGAAYSGTDLPLGCWLASNLYVFQNGGNIEWALNYHRPGSANFYTVNGVNAGTVGVSREVRFNSSSVHTAAGNMQIAHVFHYPGDLPFVTADFARAAYAYIGEEAVTRYLRLTGNARINSTTTGFTGDSKPMGAQRPAKLLDLLEECAEVDDSILMEERDDFGLNMRTRESLWNQIALALDIDAGHLSPPLDPVNDDQATRNDVTVKRVNGSFATSVQTEGPLNINAPEDDPDGVGTYDEGPEMNFRSDSQLQAAANWRRSRGTIDEVRYPGIRADYTAVAYQNSPSFAASILSKDSGDMLSILNVEVGYDATDQIVQSYTEHIDQYEFDSTFVTAPGKLYRVGVVGKTTRLATRYQFLNADFDAGVDTRLSAVLTGRPTSISGAGLWVQVADDPGSFPFEIEVAGSRLRVRATGDVLNANPYFDGGITDYVASGTTTLYWDRYPGQFKSGIASMRQTATGATTGGAVQTQAGNAVTVAGQNYQVSGWLMSNVALTDVRLAVDWYQSNGTTFISTSLPTQIATGVLTWVHFVATVTAPALGARARIKTRAVLANTDILWVDDLRIMPVTSYSASPQTLSVDLAPTNGVDNLTLPSGSPITVVQPWQMAY